VTAPVEPFNEPRFTIEPGSFRDRTARVFYTEGSVYRGLTETSWQEWQAVVASPFFKRAMAAGQIIATTPVDQSQRPRGVPPEWTVVLKHERVPFISYPYEWCFGMLKAAALLQLELLTAGSADDITLKDATPYNIQWNGARPVFIDVASFVRSRPGAPWSGYRQFCQLFLFPLMLQAYKQVPFHHRLRGRLDGIGAVECQRLMSWRDLLRPGVLTHIVAQSHLEQQYGATARDIRAELRQAGFDKQLVAATIAKLHRLVGKLTWSPTPSAWSEYADHNSYEPDAAVAKERFAESVLRTKARRLVWDLGCNTGRYAKLAGKYADYVVAVDSDHESIERLYQELKRAGTTNVLPLVGDVADPSPALGWRRRERQPMLERGRPDLVLCLALVHHLAITANIPIDDLIDWFAELGGELVVEFPLPHDPMVRRLLLNKDQRYDDYCVEYFEASLQRRFRVHERVTIPSGTRILYHATPLT